MNTSRDRWGAPLALALSFAFTLTLIGSSAAPRAAAQDDLADVAHKAYRAGGNPKFLYHEILGDPPPAPAAEGYKLLLVLPGGDGSAEFLPFVKRIYKHALPDGYIVAHLVAPKWARSEEVVWPTAKDGAAAAKFTAEKFVAAVVDEVAKRQSIDRRHVFALGWSSGGPAVYAASLAKDTPLTAVMPAMSIFVPARMPPLAAAKGRHYYILHSPDDEVCRIQFARNAQTKLTEAGAAVEFVEYPGGHGWQGDVYGNISAGVAWMEEQTAKPARPAKPAAPAK
jgi:predicted esterase